MKLQFPFIQLPVRFDAPTLAAEVAAIEETHWRPHPQGFPGNSALPLISVGGDPTDEGFAGPMRPTPHLARLPYLRDVLASLGAVFGRTRLMRLSGHAEVTPHVDQGHYWAERVRVHVPIVTQPTVRFVCGGAELNMAEGECWVFDTWRLHHVHNDAERSRIHLVADTVGSEKLWELIANGRPHHVRAPDWSPRLIAPGNAASTALAFESVNTPLVMNPWELRHHVGFLFGEAAPHPALPHLQQIAQRFLHRWQALWICHADAAVAHPLYRAALNDFVDQLRRHGDQVLLRNQVRLVGAMIAMVVKAALSGEHAFVARAAAPVASDPMSSTPM